MTAPSPPLTPAPAVPRRPPALPPRAASPWLIGGAVTVVLLLFASRYGYHRDELYFLLCGRHLAWGYVDQGPLTPALARLADTLAPGHLVALRTPSAVLSGISVVLVAAIARELGANRGAQVFAAFLAAVSGIVLAPGHLLTTTVPDLLVWLVVALFTIRLLRTGETRWALVVGAAIGVGMLNKPLPALLGGALVAGVLIAGPRRLLRDRWVLAGGALAVAIASPYLGWQLAHGLPQLSVASSIAGEDGWYSGRLDALTLQFLIISPCVVPIWLAGLVALLRRPAWRPYRPLAWAWIVAVVVVIVAGGKGYYDAPLLLVLTAAGAVVTVEWWTRGRAAARRPLVAAGSVLAAVASVMLLLPVWPADGLPGAVLAANSDTGETIGWPEFVDSVAAVYDALPPDERARAIILTGNYGEAGAVSFYGPRHGLPAAYSGHNSMVDFGIPPAAADVVIAVGWDRPEPLRRWFSEVSRAGVVDQRVAVDNQENGGPIYVCHGLLHPWTQIWRQEVRHAN